MKTARENYLYRECGFAHVTLDGIVVSRCRRCGEHEATIPLRKRLGWSGGDFAHVGVSRETVSRWETGAAAMGPVAERFYGSRP